MHLGKNKNFHMKQALALVAILTFTSLIGKCQESFFAAENYLTSQVENPDLYYEYLAVKMVNEVGNKDNLQNRTIKTHVLDSTISITSPNNYYIKTEFIWEKNRVIENNYKKIFQTEEWIPLDCSEFGFNEADQLTYFYYGTCENDFHHTTRKFFYDSDNKLIRREGFQVATGGFPENRSFTVYIYNNENQFVKSEDFRVEMDSMLLVGYKNYMYDEPGLLSSIVSYRVRNDSIGPSTFKTDSVSLSYNSQDKILRRSRYSISPSNPEYIERDRREFIYDAGGLLTKECDRTNFNSTEMEFGDIDIWDYVYGADNNLIELYKEPLRKSSQDLSAQQIYEQSQQYLFLYDNTVPFEETTFSRNHLEPYHFGAITYRSILLRNMHRSMLTGWAGYTREFAWSLWNETHYYSDLTVATKEPSELKDIVKIVPNPSINTATVIVDSKETNSICVHDSSGQLIFSQKSRVLNLEPMHPGVYIVRILFEDGTSVVKKLSKI